MNQEKARTWERNQGEVRDQTWGTEQSSRRAVQASFYSLPVLREKKKTRVRRRRRAGGARRVGSWDGKGKIISRGPPAGQHRHQGAPRPRGSEWGRCAYLSGEEEGEGEGGALVGAGEGRWCPPLDLRREEGCRRGSGNGRRGWRGRLRGGIGSGLGFRDPFIGSKRDLSHPFADERSIMIGLFGPKRACYIATLLNICHFLFSFLCNTNKIKTLLWRNLQKYYLTYSQNIIIM
jgi:hypothetical protein